MKTYLSVAALLTMLALSTALAAPLQPGDTAPAFSGKDQDGKVWKLSKLAGKKVVILYFYPKDDTPGCTKQACGWRDRMDTLKKQDVTVLGVSGDSAGSHQQFIAKHHLNFPLLADVDGKIADAYGTRKEPGKPMSRRVSFLIGRDGKIQHITDVPSAETHLKEMSAALEKLGVK